MKKLLQQSLLKDLPRILSLVDKNEYSKSFGCFDRKFWQYKILDFPCGMMQELTYPLCYVWKENFPHNIYYQNDRIEKIILGCFKYWGTMQHKDGSVDDYFPYERAYGATAYSLAALTEAYIYLGLTDKNIQKSLEQSGHFLATYRESGLLSNHLAIGAEALINLYQITKNDFWKVESDRLVDLLIEQQSSEGWFKEYQGCDLGYQTVTIEFLGRRYISSPRNDIKLALNKCMTFLQYFLHPDGSIGGEYGSRNTFNFYPGGFALLQDEFPLAKTFLSKYFYSLENVSNNFLEDDGVFSHLLSSTITTLQSPGDAITSQEFILNDNAFFPEAGLYSVRLKDYSLYGNLTKGGVYKIFKGNELIASDTGFVGELSDGTTFCQNNPESSQGQFNSGEIKISGLCKKLKRKRLGMIEMIGIRTLSMLFGKIQHYSNWIRMAMQKVLIFGNKETGITFDRTIKFSEENGIKIIDKLDISSASTPLVKLSKSSSLVNIHVVTSDSFQLTNLLPWETIQINENHKVIERESIYN